MKALYIRQHGPVADLQAWEIPAPPAGPGEVLVKVLAAGINPSDIGSVEGRFPDAPLPRVVGRDFAGRVVDGPADMVGAEVWGTGGDLGISRDGTHAEYISLPREAVARKPDNVPVEQAAAAGVPFVTAYAALVDLGQLKEGEWVIVSGAAGAVGQAAIQIAHARGARVVALVRNDDERERARSGKVDAAAQTDRDDLAEVVRKATDGRGCDLALNGVGGGILAPLLGVLAEGGRQVVYSTIGGREATLDILRFYRKRHVLLGLSTGALNAIDCARILTELTPMFEAGALEPPSIAARYDLSRAAEAYTRVAKGSSGKIVLVPGGV